MTMALLGVLGTVAVLQGFILDANGSNSITLNLPVDSVRSMMHQVSVLERHMPGVVAIEPCGQPGEFMYRTVREIPFSGEMRTDFQIRRTVDPDGSIVYRTPDIAAANWMSFRFNVTPAGDHTTVLTMTLRVRLVRENGIAIHILAPVLGEEFLSEEMGRDITSALSVFADRLTDTLGGSTSSGDCDAR